MFNESIEVVVVVVDKIVYFVDYMEQYIVDFVDVVCKGVGGVGEI